MARKSIKSEFEEAVEAEVLSAYKSNWIPTGFNVLDKQLIGRGGIPTKRLTEISGKPGACKSVFLLQIMANAQKMFPKKRVLLVDTEFVFDPEWAEQQGVDLNRLDVIQSNIAEDVYDDMIDAVSTDVYSVVGLDSLGNLDPRKNFIDHRFRDKAGKAKVDQPGVFEKITTAAIKRMVPEVNKNNVALIIVNQDRASFAMYGENITNPGGNNYRHNLSIRMRLSRAEDIIIDKQVVGMFINVRLARSKVSAAGSTDKNNALQFVFKGGQGQIQAYQLWNDAVYAGLIVRNGPTYSFEQLGVKWKGRENAIAAIAADEELRGRMKEIVDNAEIPTSSVEEDTFDDE